MIVPYSNYLAFRNAHPDDEDDMYRIDNTFSDSDHLKSGTAFLMKLGSDFFDYFQWIDTATPTGISDNKRETITNNHCYDLQGRRVSGKPTQPGLYIVNGKLVVIK